MTIFQNKVFRLVFGVLVFCLPCVSRAQNNGANELPDLPFGEKFPRLEWRASGNWWEHEPTKQRPLNLNVPRDQVIAFALYTHDHGQLKLSTQLFPLLPDEPKKVRLEFRHEDGSWQEIATEHRKSRKNKSNLGPYEIWRLIACSADCRMGM